jgi:hypothetical protein
MQHHGAPTRLLDWTYSPYVALFFALEFASVEGTPGVFVADVDWLTSAASNSAPLEIGGALLEYLKTFTQPRDESFERLFLQNRGRYVAPVNPYLLNERLTIQRGIFLAPGQVDVSFEENLVAMEGALEGIRLFTIPRREREPLLRALYAMNITAATLFPGLDGFSRSLCGWIPHIEMIRSRRWVRAVRGRAWKDI